MCTFVWGVMCTSGGCDQPCGCWELDLGPRKSRITASCLAASPAAQMAFFKENVLLWFFKDYNTVQGNIFELNDF